MGCSGLRPGRCRLLEGIQPGMSIDGDAMTIYHGSCRFYWRMKGDLGYTRKETLVFFVKIESLQRVNIYLNDPQVFFFGGV